MKLPCILASALCALAALSPSAATLNLMGTVGDAPIVMTLDVEESGKVSGSYFFRKAHRSIALSGARSGDDTLSLCGLWSVNKACDDLQLQATSSGQLRGKWLSNDGASQTVALAPLDLQAFVRPSTELAPPTGEDDAYDWALLADLALQKDKEERVQGRRLQWWLEPISGVRLFRVEEGYPSATLDAINKILAARHWEAIAAALNCGAINKPGEHYNVSLTATPRLLGATLFSVDIFERSECGGSHANVGSRPVNLDLSNGQVLTLPALLGLHNDGAAEQETSGDSELAKWLVMTLTALYPKQMAEDQGFFAKEALWENAFWYATSKGIYVGPTYPENSSGPLPAWSILPWSPINTKRGTMAKKFP